MKTTQYREALERIRAEYMEMPGMRLTLQQLQRLAGVDLAVCSIVVDELVRVQFLRAGADGRYLRDADGVARPRTAKAGLRARGASASRRAG